MLAGLPPFLDGLLGLHLQSQQLEFRHMAVRAIVVFLFGVALVRFADRRLLGANSAFDVLLWVILGSVLSRGVNGQASFFPSLGASIVLVLLHHFLSAACYRWHRVSLLTKGGFPLLVKDGKIDHEALRRSNITYDDLDQNLRLNGNVGRIEDVAEARLERNGSISVVRK